jgi:hypothetical protein
MADENKCEHDGCVCPPISGEKYCCEYCQEANSNDATTDGCECGCDTCVTTAITEKNDQAMGGTGGVGMGS